jgi:cytochrome c oxidase cbb3-type subunit IV
MDFITHFSTAFTVVSFVVFIGIVAWAYSRGARAGFDIAARLPLDEPTGGAGVCQNRVQDRS